MFRLHPCPRKTAQDKRGPYPLILTPLLPFACFRFHFTASTHPLHIPIVCPPASLLPRSHPPSTPIFTSISARTNGILTLHSAIVQLYASYHLTFAPTSQVVVRALPPSVDPSTAAAELEEDEKTLERVGSYEGSVLVPISSTDPY